MTATAVPVRQETPPDDRPPVRIVVAAIAFAAVVTAAVVFAGVALRDRIPMFELDFRVYHMGGSAVLNGISPFDVATDRDLLFTYSPFAALVFVPFGAMNVHVAFGIYTFASVLSLVAVIWLAIGLVDSDTRAGRTKFTILAAAAALVTAPVWMMVCNGQINILLTLLVLADVARRPGRLQGVGVGIAAGIKLTPLIFIPYFLFTGRIRAAVVSAVTFAATVLLSFVVIPGPTEHWLGGTLLDTTRMMPPDHGPWNESIRGVLGQLPGVLHASWLAVALTVVVGLAGLTISVLAHRRGMVAAGVIACGVTGLLVSPLSWPHHWVWVVPGVAAWLWWALRRRNTAHIVGALAAWVVLVVSAVLMLLDDSPVADIVVRVLDLSPAGLLMLNSLPVLAGLVYLGTLAGILRRKVAA
jgi:alpha-1,2-mannosyltransferase